MTDNANDEANYPHKLLLTNRKVAYLRKAFANKTSANTKLLQKIKQKNKEKNLLVCYQVQSEMWQQEK